MFSHDIIADLQGETLWMLDTPTYKPVIKEKCITTDKIRPQKENSVHTKPNMIDNTSHSHAQAAVT